MIGPGKRVNEVKIRLTDQQMLLVGKLAHADDRTLADYINHVISLHVFGHGYKLAPGEIVGNQSDRGDE